MTNEARLAHKRALDRKSQNAKRERTRLRIQTLEQQLAACEERLRAAAEDKARLEGENERLRALVSPAVDDPRSACPQISPVLQTPLVLPELLPAVPVLPGPQTAPLPSLFHALPCNSAPTCLSDEIIDTFLQSQRPSSILPSPATEQPNVLSLLRPENAVAISPVLRVTSDVLRAFTDIATLPEQVAGLCLMFRLLNWRLHPTADRYKELPTWLRPLPVQLRIPHPAWMDAIPWPNVRAHLVSHQHDYNFDTWSAFYSAGLTVSWPYTPSDAIVAVSRDEVVASPVFEQHWQDLRNWDTSAAFKRTYPEIGVLIGDRCR